MAVFKVIGVGEDGKYMDDQARADVLAYCQRDGKIPHGYVSAISVNPMNALEEMETVANLYNKNKGLRLRHWIISFALKEISNLELAAKFAFEAMMYYGERYQIISFVHEDTLHIHCHFVMNTVSFVNGVKYHGTKADYYGYIGYLNSLSAPYGFPVIATTGNDRLLS